MPRELRRWPPVERGRVADGVRLVTPFRVGRVSIVRFLLALSLAALPWSRLAAVDDDNHPPDGLPVGPLFVAPFLAAGTFYDTNPFYRAAKSLAAGEGTTDIVTRASPGVTLALPFRQSLFKVEYDATFRHYARSTTQSNSSQHALADLSLRFGSLDRLTFSAERTRGAADTIRFDGGEAVYDGTPYDFGQYAMELTRDEPGHIGYDVRLGWNALGFDRTTVRFFEYSGFEGSVDYRQPISPHSWLLAGAGLRRYDHHLATDPPGTIYRRERTNTLRFGAEGVGHALQSWRAVLEYNASTYPGGAGSDFRGLGGELYLYFALGPSATVVPYATRRTWSSFYVDSNYYVATDFGIHLEKRWQSENQIGADVGYVNSDYPDVVFDPVSLTDVKRRDRSVRVEVYGTFGWTSLYRFRISGVHQSRNSNAGDVSYRGDAIGIQFVVGWF